MKKIFNICLLFAVTAGFVACSDDNGAGSSYVQENTVKIVKSNLVFNALAQKGSVVFTAPKGTSVSVSDPWATAQLKDDSVLVSVTNNPAVDSRSAILTLKNGEDSVSLSIVQSGSVFKYTGKKSFLINNNETTLSLPYTKLGSEPTISVADKADSAAIRFEDKDSAFLAHVGANTSGAFRSFSLVVSNQDRHDTITVTQGSIDNLVGKTSYLMGYDYLKLKSTTVSTEELQTEISGKFEKTSESTLTFVANQTGTRILFDFNEKDFSLKLSAGQIVHRERTAEGSFLYRTAIWDQIHYLKYQDLLKQVNQAHDAKKLTDEQYNNFKTNFIPGLFSFYDSNKLSMLASLNISKHGQEKALLGVFGDSGTNASYISSLTKLGEIGFPIDKFTANLFSIYEYKFVNGKVQFVGPSFMLYPLMIIQPLSETTNAKESGLLAKKLLNGLR